MESPRSVASSSMAGYGEGKQPQTDMAHTISRRDSVLRLAAYRLAASIERPTSYPARPSADPPRRSAGSIRFSPYLAIVPVLLGLTMLAISGGCSAARLGLALQQRAAFEAVPKGGLPALCR